VAASALPTLAQALAALDERDRRIAALQAEVVQLEAGGMPATTNS
jgi:uncharacterized small protein (DUF1192 family)